RARCPLLPGLVARQRRRRDDGDPIARRREGREVDLQLGVAERRAAERRLAHDVTELRAAASVEVTALGEQEVELALGAQHAAELGDRGPQTARLARVA